MTEATVRHNSSYNTVGNKCIWTKTVAYNQVLMYVSMEQWIIWIATHKHSWNFKYKWANNIKI